MILLTDVISQSSNFCWIVLDETTYYITAFAVDSNNAVISSQQTTITTDFWWHPSANTLARYPLTSSSTIYDRSWNGRTLTNNWTQFWTYWWIDCAYFQRTNSKKLYWTLPLTWNQNFTINVYIKRSWDWTISWNVWTQIFVLWNIWSSWWCFWTAINNWSSEVEYKNMYKNYTRWNDKNSSYTNTLNVWRMITVINNGWNIKMYENWVLINNNSISFNINSTNFTIWSFPSTTGSWDYQSFYWYMSEFIVENKVRTLSEIQAYYNKTKSKYWL